MSESEQIVHLEEEIERLKEENQMLLKIVDRMRVTLNRLICNYMTGGRSGKMA